MLDPEVAGKIWQEHFDTVTDEEFIANVRRVSPDSAQELWGDLSVEEILSRRRNPIRRALHRLMHVFWRSRRVPV
jgi:uncharacterized protein YciU (UPF0263 family)